MNEFLSMGGYAASVWPAIVLTLGIILWNIFAARRSFESARNEARRRVATEHSA